MGDDLVKRSIGIKNHSHYQHQQQGDERASSRTARQKWMTHKYGALFVWPEGEQSRMIIMAENAAGKTTFGLLTSPDGKKWTLLAE